MAIFFDDFNRADSESVGNGWVENRAGAFEILGSELKGTADGTQYWLNQVKAPRSGDLQDGDIITEFVFDTATTGVPQLHGRYNDVDTFYIVYLLGTSINLCKYIGGLTTLATTAFSALQANRKYRLTLSMDGTFIRAALWDAVDGVHIATVGAVDGIVTASGKSCLSVGAGGSPILYDNFRAISGADRKIPYTESFLDANNFIGQLTTSGTVAVATYKNSKKLKLTGGGASAKDYFVEPNVPYIVECDMESPSTSKLTLEGLDASNNVIFSVEMDGAVPQGSFDTDNGTPTTFPWTAGEPKQIQVLIDPVGKTARCFYSTGVGGPGDTWPAVSVAKSYTNVSITQWRLITNAAGTGDCYLDEIKVYIAGLAWIGDSITSGHGLSAGGAAEWGANPNDNSRGRSGESEGHILNYQYMFLQTNPEWSLGRGVDGDESDEVDLRVTGDVVDAGSTGAVVWVGTNDIQNSTLTLAQTKANITSILDKLQAGGIVSGEITLVECAPRQFTSSQRSVALKNADKDALNVWLYGESQRQGCKIAQVHDLLQGSPDLLHANFDATDGVHLNTAGLKLVAETVNTATAPPPGGALFARHIRQLQMA